MPLMSNLICSKYFCRVRVKSQLKRLERATPQGGTRLDLGLMTTNRQIQANRDSRASVVIVLTDANIPEQRRKSSLDEVRNFCSR